MAEHTFVPLDFERLTEEQMIARAQSFREELARRRSVRHFSDEPVPREVLEECVCAAGSAPSGAHKQPWTFIVITDAQVQRSIREAAEEEERRNYGGRMNDEWLRDLAPLGTDASKPFLEIAPALIVMTRHAWEEKDGERRQNYYTQESVGIAAGFLLAALHHAGLATLTHTPSPMGFLQRILGRPAHEKPFLLIPVGYPVEGCEVPDLERKALEEILVWA
ncbi:MAG: nitroreductase family protein [bacterium]|nr:nitroreductase family protein [bacterium]